MIIKSAKQHKPSRGELVKLRNEKLADYNSKLDAYNQQVTSYQDTYNLNVESTIKKVREYLSPEIDGFDHPVEIAVKEYGYNSRRYYVRLSYSSGSKMAYKSNGPILDAHSGYIKGISWSLVISTKLQPRLNADGSIYRDADGNKEVTVIVDKNPNIDADFLESDDYATLLAMYKLFTKIDTVDWASLLEETLVNTPSEHDYITLEEPVRPADLDSIEEGISYYEIERTMNSDSWVKVKIRRESSFNWRSAYHDVIGRGWVRVTHATDSYFTFHFLKIYQEGYGGNQHDVWEYSASDIEEALSQECRLKKSYFTLIKPVEYMSTDELLEFSKGNEDNNDDD